MDLTKKKKKKKGKAKKREDFKKFTKAKSCSYFGPSCSSILVCPQKQNQLLKLFKS